MNIWKIILGTLKLYGRDAVEAALAKALKRTTPARWEELSASFGSCQIACLDKDEEVLAEELTEVLFSIKP